MLYDIIKNSFGSGKRSFATAKNSFPKSVGYLSCVRERLKDVVIENLDFEQLIKTFVLSYNDDGYIRELYKNFFMFEVKRKNNLSANKMVEEFRESVIKNYK